MRNTKKVFFAVIISWFYAASAISQDKVQVPAQSESKANKYVRILSSGVLLNDDERKWVNSSVKSKNSKLTMQEFCRDAIARSKEFFEKSEIDGIVTGIQLALNCTVEPNGEPKISVVQIKIFYKKSNLTNLGVDLCEGFLVRSDGGILQQ